MVNDLNFIRCSYCGNFEPDDRKYYGKCLLCGTDFTVCLKCGRCHYCEKKNDVNCLMVTKTVDTFRQSNGPNVNYVPF